MDVRYPIRPVDDAELPIFGQVSDQAFNSNVPPDTMLEFDRLVIEPERTLVAFDGDQAVGTTLAFSFGLTVPGGDNVGAAGISGVSVLPTHRRRGILSSLMRRQLADVAAGSEPVAALFASESAIYGRYGYGSAAEQYGFTFRRGDGSLRLLPDLAGHPAPTPALRLAEPKSALAELKAVYEAVRRTRPGLLTRHDGWWEASVADPESLRQGNSPLRCVIAEDESGPRGYALYAAKPDWGHDGMPAQVLFVRELFWTDPASAAALWGDLLSRDLVIEVRTRMRPVDDPIQHLLVDPRRTRAKVSDGLWIRIVDLPEALMRRRYLCPVDMVIEVADPQLPANGGRWRLVAGGLADDAKPTCERSTASADITLPVAALGAAYLGGTRLGGLAAAGQVTEHRPGALTALSAALWWDPAPWSPMMF